MPSERSEHGSVTGMRSELWTGMMGQEKEREADRTQGLASLLPMSSDRECFSVIPFPNFIEGIWENQVS